ncbi:abhydrolase domain-containing protein 2 [Cylas formicarius]|uniref:abhydrolase domain-containing protein 2 n=1 Tax=Cylas formicarius TaxID=197179 RepID=UPI00295842CC|nr:abhydrolase domain-containing protein 2 [Cylas formicarius]
MSTAILAAVAVILCILFRILNVSAQPQKPTIWCGDNNFLENILKISPLLNEPYIPTRLWGFSGHVQTILHSVIGRVKCPWPIGERVFLTLQDGTTLTYDLYQPLDTSFPDDVSVAICPGICNTSESVYIRTFVHWAQCHGYRCAVLNHVGALSKVPVTAPRIFSYGSTDDFHAMLLNLICRHPNTKLVCVGFSLGGNIVTKYLGESGKIKHPNIMGGISICQGYNAIEGTKWLLNWQNFRRFYLYVMTENMKNIILRHSKMLLNEDIKQRHNLSENEIISAATLPELDEAYTRRVHGFGSVSELYKWSSSINYINSIEHPVIFINAKDDPIVPEPLLQPVRDISMEKPNTAHIELMHGGHLGFYEGGFIYPNPITWLDRTLVALIGSLALNYDDKIIKSRSNIQT